MIEHEGDFSEWYTTTQAADYLGITRTRVHQLIQLGRLKYQRLGREYLIHKDELDHRLEETGKTGLVQADTESDEVR